MQNDKRIEQANTLLYEYKLLEKLNEFGTSHLIGSYRMNLMSWNDLDIYVENENISLQSIYKITTYILENFKPKWFEGKEDVMNGKKCYFIGFETELLNELWNIDIWFFDKDDIIKSETYCDDISDKANSDVNIRNAILNIKSDLLIKSGYGDKYFSVDVYNAVINFDVQNTAEFLSWFESKKK